MRYKTGAVIASLAIFLVFASFAAAQHSGHGDNPHEGAISITGEGTLAWMTVLGGSLGNETVGGLDVGLFVLQAENPARLAPGAEGPTHVFNLTFLKAEESGSVEGVTGNLLVEVDGKETVTIPFRPHENYYQATTRLESEGHYRLSVVFNAAGREGRAGSFPFEYRRKKHMPEAGHGDHTDHSGHHP